MNMNFSGKLSHFIPACFFTTLIFLGLSAHAQDVESENGMVASAHGMASEAGVMMLKQGGNAVDAAVASAFALAAVEPNTSGLGGGGYIVLKMHNAEEFVFLDYRETAGSRTDSSLYYQDKDSFKSLSLAGAASVGVPGMVAGLLALHERYGSLPLEQVLRPAIHLAEDGFAISDKLSDIILQKFEIISTYPETAGIFLQDLLPPPTGTLLRNPRLAESIRQIGQEGAKVFYSGKIGQAIVSTLDRYNGMITLDDLRNYKPRFSKPVTGTYKSFQIVSAAPSSGGGMHLIELLNILEGYDLKSMGHNSAAYIHILAEGLKIVLKDKETFAADPEFFDVPVTRLTSKSYAQSLREYIKPETASFEYQPESFSHDESGSTTHLSVIDKDRNIVALTQSINYWFGSGVTADSTGILLNNHIDDFDHTPGKPNSIAAGKRPVSSIAPTLIFKDGEPLLTIGTPGGTRIIAALAQIILNITEFDMTIDEAIEAPRIHAIDKNLYLEDRIAQDVISGLKAMGHDVKIRESFDAFFGGAQGILIKDAGKTLSGGADSRRDGVAVGY